MPEEPAVRARHARRPPHYMMVGFTPTGGQVVLIAYNDGFDWWLFRAYTPITPGFRKEYVKNGGII